MTSCFALVITLRRAYDIVYLYHSLPFLLYSCLLSIISELLHSRAVPSNSPVRTLTARPSALETPDCKLDLRIWAQIARRNVQKRKRLVRVVKHRCSMNTAVNVDFQDRTINHAFDVPHRAIVDVGDAELARPEDVVCEAVGVRAVEPEGVIAGEEEASADRLAGHRRDEGEVYGRVGAEVGRVEVRDVDGEVDCVRIDGGEVHDGGAVGCPAFFGDGGVGDRFEAVGLGD